jgi:hypothetical protein
MMTLQITPTKPQFICIIPTPDLLSDKAKLQEILSSHDWDIDRAQPQGDQILVKIHCSR